MSKRGNQIQCVPVYSINFFIGTLTMKHANNWTIFEHQKTLKNVLLLIRERERERERERARERE